MVGGDSLIGETKNNIDPEQNKAIIALRDAFVVFLLVLVTNLISVGYPPTVEQVYQPLLASILMGIISYMHALGIKKPEE